MLRLIQRAQGRSCVTIKISHGIPEIRGIRVGFRSRTRSHVICCVRNLRVSFNHTVCFVSHATPRLVLPGPIENLQIGDNIHKLSARVPRLAHVAESQTLHVD